MPTRADDSISQIAYLAGTLKGPRCINTVSIIVTLISIQSTFINICWEERILIPYVNFLRYFPVYIPVHTPPTSWYPSLQLHRKLPAVLIQTEFAEQLSLLVAHSSISIGKQQFHLMRNFKLWHSFIYLSRLCHHPDIQGNTDTHNCPQCWSTQLVNYMNPDLESTHQHLSVCDRA